MRWMRLWSPLALLQNQVLLTKHFLQDFLKTFVDINARLFQQSRLAFEMAGAEKSKNFADLLHFMGHLVMTRVLLQPYLGCGGPVYDPNELGDCMDEQGQYSEALRPSLGERFI